jgi:gamma-glutamylcysteine synthetase
MKYILLIFTLFFSACSIKNYEHTQTKIITIKSPKIKFSDVGYLRNSEKSIELELFMAGKNIEKISVNHLICTSEGCMSRSGFNKDYLNAAYPDDTLQNILLSRAIYGGVNLSKTADGFSQSIKDEHVDISYKVESSGVYFKDRKNGIIFNIKDIDE